jgi:hypothetical protein
MFARKSGRTYADMMEVIICCILFPNKKARVISKDSIATKEIYHKYCEASFNGLWETIKDRIEFIEIKEKNE